MQLKNIYGHAEVYDYLLIHNLVQPFIFGLEATFSEDISKVEELDFVSFFRFLSYLPTYLPIYPPTYLPTVIIR